MSWVGLFMVHRVADVSFLTSPLNERRWPMARRVAMPSSISAAWKRRRPVFMERRPPSMAIWKSRKLGTRIDTLRVPFAKGQWVADTQFHFFRCISVAFYRSIQSHSSVFIVFWCITLAQCDVLICVLFLIFIFQREKREPNRPGHRRRVTNRRPRPTDRPRRAASRWPFVRVWVSVAKLFAKKTKKNKTKQYHFARAIEIEWLWWRRSFPFVPMATEGT